MTLCSFKLYGLPPIDRSSEVGHQPSSGHDVDNMDTMELRQNRYVQVVPVKKKLPLFARRLRVMVGENKACRASVRLRLATLRKHTRS